MGRVVSCRECESEVELPEVAKPGKVYRCPDCREPLPTPKSRPADDEERVKRPKRRDEDELDEDEPPRKRKKRRPEPEAKPFWQSKQGRILSGAGLLLLGVVAIAAVVLLEARRPWRGYIGGGLCVLFGLGGIASGLTGSDDDGGESGDDE